MIRTDSDIRKALPLCVEGGMDASGMIRARSRTGTSCIGDSGGPLLARGSNEIAGVLSGGDETQCDASGGNLYAPLASNLDFVDEALSRSNAR